MTAKLDAIATCLYAGAHNVADPAHETGPVFSVGHSTSSVTLSGTIPRNCRSRQWDLLAKGANVQFGFVRKGSTAPTLVYAQASAMGTGHAAAAPCDALDGVLVSVWCPADAERFVYISDAAPAAPAFFKATLSSAGVGAGSVR